MKEGQRVLGQPGWDGGRVDGASRGGMKRCRLVFGSLLLTGVGLGLSGTGRAQTYDVIYSFTVPPSIPAASLFKGSDGKLYGTTQSGGALSNGSVFQADTAGPVAFIHTFSSDEGSYVRAPVVQGTDGSFYGMSVYGGADGNGAIFKVNSAGTFSVVHSFDYSGSDGANPYGGLIQATDGNFYGTTTYGGDNNWGVIFKMTSGGTVTVLHVFAGADGVYPWAGLVQGTDGKLYGTTLIGGTSTAGTFFRIDTTGSNFTKLHDFVVVDGTQPSASLIQASDGKFYGTTKNGAGGHGSVFQIDTAGNLTVLHSFTGTDGDLSQAALVQGTDSKLYGVTASGGSSGNGTAFRIDTTGNNFTTLHNFSGGSDGSAPLGGLVQAADGNFYGTTSSGGANGGGTYFRMDTLGNVTTFFAFGATSTGYEPTGSLLQGSDGKLYGSAYLAGNPNDGAVFRTDTSGNLTVVHTFTGSDGANPNVSLFQGSDGLYYGMTTNGGTNDAGAAYKVTSAGTLTTLRSFNVTDGVSSNGGLLQGADGKYYGTMYGGGGHGYGTVFRIESTGANFTTLHSFNFSDTSDGADPRGNLIQDAGGTFYGTTEAGGANGYGTVYKMTAAGVVTLLHSFNSTDGYSPYAGVILASDGKLYGTTYGGGTNLAGTVYRVDTTGSNFATLHSFNQTDGASPYGGVIQGTDGNFYGTTQSGGANNRGTIFKITSGGTLTTLHSFNEADGSGPAGGLLQASDGNFYGTTNLGGAGASGVVYRLAICTPPSPPVAGNDGPKCVGQTLHLTASTVAGATYAWTGPNGFVSSLQNPSIASVTLAAAGTYNVTVTVSGCTSAPAMTTVVINPLPSATITAPASVAAGSTGNAASVPDAGPGSSYAWGITNGTITGGAGTRSITFTAGASGSVGLSVTVTNGNGCSAPGAQAVTIVAAAARVFVSAQVGNDANTCTLTLPCRTFTRALPFAQSRGELIVLDSGGYGPFTILHAVSVLVPQGVYAGITASSGDAITVSAGASDVVSLRGLTINSLGGTNGIRFATGAALLVESCSTSGFSDSIRAEGGGDLSVRDTRLRGATSAAIHLLPSSPAQATLVRCRVEDSASGLSVTADTSVSISESVFSGNTGAGISCAAGDVSVDDSLLTGNGTGASASGTGTLRLSDTCVTDNATGLAQSGGGTLVSRTNNTVEGNTTNTSGTIGTYSPR
jgi:uncharacterized repeat protein (TIGR03803 family)